MDPSEVPASKPLQAAPVAGTAAAPATPPLMLIARRRSGAGEIFNLLGGYLEHPNAGAEPFSAGQAFEPVARAFNDGRYWEMRRLIRQVLGPQPWFKHQYDVEPIDLSMNLFEAMAEAGYRAIVFEREAEAERLFSLAVCTHYNVWGNDGTDALLRRARAGETLGAPSIKGVRSLVRAEVQRQRWFDRAFAGSGIAAARFTYEAFYRRGVSMLDEMNRLFHWAGIANREACIGDESLVRFAFRRGHYMLGLVQYSRGLSEVYEAIDAELQELAGGEPRRAADPSRPAGC